MGAFGGLILTNKGRNLQAKAQTSVSLVFTRIALGDGTLSGQNIIDLNVLINQKLSLPISKLKTQTGGKAVVGAILNNSSITSGFYFREIGVFAQDPDIGEVLYCYGNCGTTAEYIPAGGGPDIIEKNIDIVTIVGNANNVSAIIDDSLVIETPTGAQEKANAAETNAKQYTDNKVSAIEEDLTTLEQIVSTNQQTLTTHLNKSASLTTDGHVQLQTTINDSETKAATPKAVRLATEQLTYKTYRSGKDTNGIYTTVEKKRSDGTLAEKSQLSGGTSPNYTTRTITYYGLNGTTIEKTVTRTLSYDGDGDWLSEV